MKRILVLSIICTMLLSLSSCCLQHSWREADCEHPRTCEKCGKTEGEPLGHAWEEATCKKPRTCTRCGTAEGEPLDHTPGEWEETRRDVVEAQVSYVQKCVRCGKVVNTRHETMEHMFENKEFLLTTADFESRYLNLLEENWNREDWSIARAALPDKLQYKVFSKTTSLGYIDFLNRGEFSITEEQDTEKIAYVLSGFGYRDDWDEETIFWAMNGLIRTFDPMMTVEDTEKFIYSLIQEGTGMPYAVREKNGLGYVFFVKDKTFLLLIYCA